jgi:alpha-glucosidase (family GH31 glycosyl hydrolase)
MLRRSAFLFLISVCASCSEDTPDPLGPATTAPDPDPCTDIAKEDALPPPGTAIPRWVFEPWISKDISDRADTYAFVDGFRERGIPVGAVVLDSPWETHYNTFEPMPSRYGDFPSLVKEMHDRDVKVVLWITSAVNQQSFDFEPGGDAYQGASPNLEKGLECKFFIDDGETYGWWKGKGAFVDFFHPRARTWWHAQQDRVLDMGIDGWKLDFGESYILNDALKTFEGTKTLQEYSERYYEDFLAYGRKKRGPDFVTMVRAWDESYQFPGRFFAKKEHGPVFWMGDNRRDWVGLEDALDHQSISAKAGYSVVGSDIGGYLDRDDKALTGDTIIPFDTLNFARWIASSALSPFMQLHGRANLTPWTVPDNVDETVALYKYWARLHHAIAQWLFERAQLTTSAGLPQPLLVPVGGKGDHRYVLGDAFLVAPILDATGKRDVAFPEGARWFDWWTGAAHEGGTTVATDFSADRAKIPVYLKAGSILKLELDDPEDVIGFSAASWAIWPGGKSTYGTELSVDETATNVTIAVTGGPANPVLRVRLEAAPASVTGGDFTYDAARKVAVIASNAPTVTITR